MSTDATEDEKVCDQCGEPLNTGSRFCSHACYVESRRKYHECEWCGGEYRRTNTGADREQRFCSRECVQAERAADVGFQKVCPQCGEDWTAPRRDRVYCSQECQHASLRGYAGGTISHNVIRAVKNRLTDRPWREVAGDLRADECEHPDCGVTGGRQELDVHHIVPVRAGGVHAEELTMTLCATHHQRAERFTEQYVEAHLEP